MRATCLFLAIHCSGIAFAQSPLDNCAEQFIDGKITNAPTLADSESDEPLGNNKHLCYRDDGVSFLHVPKSAKTH